MNDDTNRQRDQKPWESPQAKWRLCCCTCISCIFAQSRQMADPARHCDKCDINNPPPTDSGGHSQETGFENRMAEGTEGNISILSPCEESIANVQHKHNAGSNGDARETIGLSRYERGARYDIQCKYCPKPVLCGRCPLRNDTHI